MHIMHVQPSQWQIADWASRTFATGTVNADIADCTFTALLRLSNVSH